MFAPTIRTATAAGFAIVAPAALDATGCRLLAQSPPLRAEANLTNGADHERGTLIQFAPRRRGIAHAPPPVTSTRGTARVPSSKLVYQAWAMESSLGSGDLDVFFARSTDGGVTVSTPTRLEAQTGMAREVSVCASEDRVFVSWISNEIGTKDQVYVAISVDQGETFAPPLMLNDPALAQAGDADEHWTVAAGYLFYAVWEFDDRGRVAGVPDEDVHFCRLIVDESGLQSRSANVRLNTPVGLSDVNSPIVTASPDGGKLAVLWFDDRGAPDKAIYGVWSTALGFDLPKAQDQLLVGAPAATAAKQNVLAALRGNSLHLVWEDRRNAASGGGADEPFYERFDLDSGSPLYGNGRSLVDWSMPGFGDADQPWIAIDSDDERNVLVAWHDNRDRGGAGNDTVNDLFCTVSRDGGATWSANQRVAKNSGTGTGQRNEAWGAVWHGDHAVLCALRSELNGIGGPGAGTEDVVLFVSRDGARQWEEQLITAVGSSVGLANDIDNPYMAVTPTRLDVAVSYYDDRYPNWQGHGDLIARGLRLPWIRASADPVGGATVRLLVEQIGESNNGGGALLVYNGITSGTAPGVFPFGSGLDIDLIPDALTMAFAGITPLAVLSTQPDGTATTIPFTLPAGYLGPRFQVQALVFDSALRVTEGTDVLAF